MVNHAQKLENAWDLRQITTVFQIFQTWTSHCKFSTFFKLKDFSIFRKINFLYTLKNLEKKSFKFILIRRYFKAYKKIVG